MSRILKGVTSTITLRIYVNGVLADPDAAVNVAITNLVGTELVAATAATKRSTGIYDFAVTPVNLDTLTATWTYTVGGVVQTAIEQYEVTGDHLFTIADARAFGDAALASTATYPDETIAGARDRIAEEFERICRQTFAPRYKLVTIDGGDADDPRDSVWLPDLRVTAIRSAEQRTIGTTTWVALTAAQLADLFVSDTGRAFRELKGPWIAGRQNVRIGYEYGYPEPPLEIHRAALQLIRGSAVPTDINSRALSITDELGTFRLATAGERGAWTGIPDVDAVLDRYASNVGRIG